VSRKKDNMNSYSQVKARFEVLEFEDKEHDEVFYATHLKSPTKTDQVKYSSCPKRRAHFYTLNLAGGQQSLHRQSDDAIVSS